MTAKTRLLGIVAVAFAGITVANAQPAPGSQSYGNESGYDRDQRGDVRDNGAYDGRRDRGDRQARRDRPRAILFVDDKFNGHKLMIDRPIARLSDYRMGNKVSSIDVRGGSWLVCTGDDFAGRCVTIRHSITKLSKLDLDDKISSIRPLTSDF